MTLAQLTAFRTRLYTDTRCAADFDRFLNGEKRGRNVYLRILMRIR